MDDKELIISLSGVGAHHTYCRVPDEPCICGVAALRREVRALVEQYLTDTSAPCYDGGMFTYKLRYVALQHDGLRRLDTVTTTIKIEADTLISAKAKADEAFVFCTPYTYEVQVLSVKERKKR